jgi:6-pyruvoyltetrahydropterin/6-carboxytetrahydropterin synthase
MYEVTITDWFAAAHQLRLLDGQLEPLHGHNWRVAVTLAGPELDKMGVLADFTWLKPRLAEILAPLHDRNLNDQPAFARRNPSAENVATYIAEQIALDLSDGVQLACVEVEEAPYCVARYKPT